MGFWASGQQRPEHLLEGVGREELLGVLALLALLVLLVGVVGVAAEELLRFRFEQSEAVIHHVGLSF
jgi:hypothetical protein